jgi:hypothetical protein
MASHLMMLLVPSAASGPAVTVADYLVVAGGGGGGELNTGGNGAGGGSGGAGGVLDGAVALLRGQAVTVTVGTGGADGLQNATAANGTDSVLASLTATGGGGGGSAPASVPGTGANGGNGGSGGGAGQGGSGGTDGTAGTGIAGQGTGGTLQQGGGRYLYSEITGVPYFYGQPGAFDANYTPRDNFGDGGRGGTITGSGGIVVEGAGTAAANGTYQPDGTFSGETKYRLGTTDWYIIIRTADNWVIATFDGSTYTDQYTLNSVPADPLIPAPPPAGPATEVNGASPAPTISNEITTVAPTAGASGVVIIAYPDTLPALTVSGGLTYDEPTRAGYRVYRFTSGTGTITP